VRPTAFTFIVPFVVMLIITGIMLGLGTIFTLVGNTGTIILGLAIMLGSGSVAFLLTRRR
jgi:hypothetical protein